MPRSAKEANNPILLKVQSLQLSFRPAGVSLGGGGGGPRPPLAPPCVRPCTFCDTFWSSYLSDMPSQLGFFAETDLYCSA